MAAAGADGSEARLDGTLRPDDRRGIQLQQLVRNFGKDAQAAWDAGAAAIDEIDRIAREERVF
jgi:hypothetical protein